jgi:hypothetical protein
MAPNTGAPLTGPIESKNRTPSLIVWCCNSLTGVAVGYQTEIEPVDHFVENDRDFGPSHVQGERTCLKDVFACLCKNREQSLDKFE